jgi:hypothetical protein
MVEVKAMLNKLMLVAREDRASIPYSKDEGFVPKLMLIGPNDETYVTAVGWKNEADKYAMMRAAADVARETFAQAIVLVSDTRWVMSDVFCAHFKIEGPDGSREGFKAYQKRYLDILREHGGQMKNLPRQLWNEAVMVAIKGPRCGTDTLMAPYTQGPGDKVLYLPPKERGEDYRHHLKLIPEWWH